MPGSSRRRAGVPNTGAPLLSTALLSIALLVVAIGAGHLQCRRNELATGQPSAGGTVPAIGSLFDRRPTLLIVGDSFASGTGDPTFRLYPYILGDRLGWNLTVDAQGGTGFINAAGAVESRGVPFVDRLARDGQLYEVDCVLIDGGRNDLGLPPPAVIAAADEYFRKVRDAWPEAEIIVVLPAFVSAVEGPNSAQISAGLRRSSAEVDAHVIDPVAQGWYRDRELGPLLWRDGVHLNAAGNEYYAGRIFDGMRALGLAR